MSVPFEALPAGVRADASLVFSFLSQADPEPVLPVDAIFGFGHFDLRIPRLCAEAVASGRAGRAVFTGGVGAGTADLGGPEADAFLAAYLRHLPPGNHSAPIVENASTNTGENLRFTAALLARDHPALRLDGGLRSAWLIASPARLRRVRQTWAVHAPAVPAAATSAPSSLAEEYQAHELRGIPYLAHLAGEVARLRAYPARGWCAPMEIPGAVRDAAQRLSA